MKRFLILIILILLLFTSCAKEPLPMRDLPEPAVAVDHFTPTPSPTLTPEPTLTPTLNPLRTIAPTLTPSPTPDPFIDLYLDSLASRKYGGGVLEDLGSLNSASAGFSRRLFRYRSEGLNMYGFINIPEGIGPFPVILMLHGYVEPEEYNTLDYSTRYADAFAEDGYVVLHPNLRGYAPSPLAENSLGIGDTIDALNLLALLRQFSGTEGLLKKADATRIGLWGHSMGGGIVMRILVIDQDIKAALLYASINADEKINLSHFEKDGRGVEKISAPDEALDQISPINFLGRFSSRVSIHHGDADIVVPPEWSDNLCDLLIKANIIVECISYEDQPHTFQNSGDTRFIANTLSFFNAAMKD